MKWLHKLIYGPPPPPEGELVALLAEAEAFRAKCRRDWMDAKIAATWREPRWMSPDDDGVVYTY